MKIFLRLIFVVIITTLLGLYYLMTPIIELPNYEDPVWAKAEERNLKKHLKFLTESETERSYENIERLDEVASYIFTHFEESRCDETRYQNYRADGKKYKNVVCVFNGENDERVVIGAHYDVDANNHHEEDIGDALFQWADDNASGVAGLLEITTMIGNDRRKKLENTLELVAYTLEEVPHYHTEKMWSYIHAKSLKQREVEVKYMISLEMIGYFSDEMIQQYPLWILKFMYPQTWDFIALVWKAWQAWHLRSIKRGIHDGADIDIYSLKSPDFIPEISMSDNWSYWQNGYEAYMLTDTSYLRNPHYHKVTDTVETLDIQKMSEVVSGVYNLVLKN